nr:hypothetical protein [Tanacetum cinerariifolium]
MHQRKAEMAKRSDASIALPSKLSYYGVTENPTNGSVHLYLDLENDGDDKMIDARSVRDLDQPPELSHRR